MAERSSSSILMDYLRDNPQVTEFTSNDLIAATGCTAGAVTGFMSRLCAAGVAERVGRKGHSFVFRTEPAFYDEIKVYKVPGNGSKPGRVRNGVKHASAPKLDNPKPAPEPVSEDKRDLVAMLLEAASIAETLTKPPLSLYSTDELLTEIRRRTNGT